MKNANPNLIAVGDNCLDAYLNKGFVTVGGNALNVAVQWKRLGYGARYFGALAPDQEADIMLGIIDDAGLARDDVEILQGKSAVTLLTDDAGERHFLLESLGVGENYIPDTQRYQELLFSDWTHLGTNSSEKLVRKLVQDGIGFSVDVSTRHFDLSLEGVPLVFASGPDDPEEPVEPLIARFKQAGAQKIVVTCGKRGSFYDNGSQLFSAGSVPVSVVDTCGAGDSFIATFLTAHFF
ncbi:MAG TPA: fructoselysine 6-kinase, partial [Ochrobactrum anthropi]|nr:fructoselysine 6-kinase [Brucella anthropi]